MMDPKKIPFKVVDGVNGSPCIVAEMSLTEWNTLTALALAGLDWIERRGSPADKCSAVNGFEPQYRIDRKPT